MVKLKLIGQYALATPRFMLLRLPVAVLATLFSSGKHLALVARLLGWHCHLFSALMKKHYIGETAYFLSQRMVGFEHEKFIERYLLNRLMSNYIQTMLIRHPWRTAYHLVTHGSGCEKTEHDLKQVKLFLCTHTGDYWLLVLNIARQLRHTNLTLVIPIFHKITPEDLAVYEKINFEGVNVQFVNIHEKKTLLQLKKWLKNDAYVVAIFYDLACYVAGIYNGAVRPVTLFNRKGGLTTGILSLTDKLDVEATLVTCNYNNNEKRYFINFSEPFKACLENEDKLISELEKYVVCFPYQWHFINNIDCYYHYPYSIISGHYRRLTEQYNALCLKYQKKG